MKRDAEFTDLQSDQLISQTNLLSQLEAQLRDIQDRVTFCRRITQILLYRLKLHAVSSSMCFGSHIPTLKQVRYKRTLRFRSSVRIPTPVVLLSAQYGEAATRLPRVRNSCFSSLLTWQWKWQCLVTVGYQDAIRSCMLLLC